MKDFLTRVPQIPVKNKVKQKRYMTVSVVIVSRGAGSPQPVGENFDSPLNFLPVGLQKLSSPPQEAPSFPSKLIVKSN